MAYTRKTKTYDNIPLQRSLLSSFGTGPFFRLATPIAMSSSSGSRSYDCIVCGGETLKLNGEGL